MADPEVCTFTESCMCPECVHERAERDGTLAPEDPDHPDCDDEPDDGRDTSSENDPDFCYECQRDLAECVCDDPDYGDSPRAGCQLGDACLHHDPFHLASECFDAEMAEAFFGEADVAAIVIRDTCPCCGGDLEQDTVDVGVGDMPIGPRGCPECFWFEGEPIALQPRELWAPWSPCTNAREGAAS